MSSGFSNIEALVPPASDGWRLDRALAAALPQLSRERLKVLISAGSVTAEGGVLIRDPATKIKGGTNFTVSIPDPRPAHNEAQDIPLVVAYEDGPAAAAESSAAAASGP